MTIRARLYVLIAAIAAMALCPIAAAHADSAPTTSTPVTATPAQVAQFLFVAGDVGRLSAIPSGTESVVLEKVLQELYAESPNTPPSQAVSDIQTLQGVLGSGSAAVSPSTLTVMAGNQRVLAILRALTDAGAPADLQHPLAQVTARALADSAQAEQVPGQAISTTFDTTDAQSNLQFGSFSASQTLTDTAALAATDKAFGQARDTLWQQASHESVFDDTQTLLKENPALQNDPINSFVALLAPDGSLSSTVGAIQGRVNDGVRQIGDQNCTLAPGANGASPSDCASGALHDAQVVSQACGSGSGCQDARNQAQSDATGELATISAQQAATAAEAAALGDASVSLQKASQAEAQAAAQIADQEQQYLDFQNFNQGVKAGTDSVALVLSLAAAEVDPAAAINGLLTVFGDLVGWQFGGPDPNTLILQGIQGLSQQLSDFSQYTQKAFSSIDSQLSSLSRQVAQDEYALSSQLSVAQGQITGLSGQLTSLQGSVDQLQSEVQTLFSQDQFNQLFTLINQTVAFAAKNNGAMLDQRAFSDAANALYTDATSGAYGSVLKPLTSGSFDAFDANGILGPTASLGASINYFDAFNPSDAPSYLTWSGPLTSADKCHGFQPLTCLPNPEYWATAARAYAQLLLENPRWVTGTYLGYLTQIQAEGQQIADAVHRLSVNDGGSTSVTGNRLLDDALTYYSYWGNDFAHPAGAPPNLDQAVRNEEQAYLATQNPQPTPQVGDKGIDPWGGVNQAPDIAHLQQSSSFTNVPLCPGVSDNLPGGTNLQRYDLPRLPAGLISFLPAPVLNAVRLGIGSISACWVGFFDNPTRGGNGQLLGQLDMHIDFTYIAPNGHPWTVGNSDAGIDVPDCTPDGSSNQTLEGVDNDIGNWPGVSNPNTQCLDMSTVMADPRNEHSGYPAGLPGVIEPAITTELTRLQAGIYSDITRSDSKLTSGMSGGQDDDVYAAAQRLGGATALLNGYVALGLPQSLSTDDALHSLIYGAGQDAFAPLDPTAIPWHVQFASDVPTQVLNFYKAVEKAMPSSDPVVALAGLVNLREGELENALSAHIVGNGSQQARVKLAASLRVAAAPAASSTTLAENDTLIVPAVDRLAEAATVLNDAEAHGATVAVTLAGSSGGTVVGSGISCPGTCSKSFAPGSVVTLTATAPAGATFAGWSGACTGAGLCTVNVGVLDQAVTATFAPGTGSVSGTGSTPNTPAGTGNGSAGAGAGKSAAPKCTVKPVSAKVLVAKPKKGKAKLTPGALLVTVKCDHASMLKLGGTVTRKVSSIHSVKSKLKTVSRSVRAGVGSSITVRLPSAVVRQLAAGARESLVLTVTPAGVRAISVNVGTLKPVR